MDGSHRGRCSVSAPVIEAEARGFRAPGTTFMVGGALIGAVGAYLFQVYGGRSLGPEAFAPIGALWTSFFIFATVLLIPVEQYVTREVSSGRKATPHDLVPAGVMAGIAALLGAGFVWLTLDRLFEGNWRYVPQIVLLMVGYSLLLVGKGVFAGQRVFAGVGWILIIESVARLVAGFVAIQWFASAESLAGQWSWAALLPSERGGGGTTRATLGNGLHQLQGSSAAMSVVPPHHKFYSRRRPLPSRPWVQVRPSSLSCSLPSLCSGPQ